MIMKTGTVSNYQSSLEIIFMNVRFDSNITPLKARESFIFMNFVYIYLN